MGPQMARDAKIEDVTGRWAPRFISNGVPLTDYQEVTGSLETWEDWCKAWAGRAAVHEAMGRALERARGGEGPSFIETVIPRFDGHFVGDPQPFRTQEEMDEARANDCLVKFREKVLGGTDPVTADADSARRKACTSQRFARVSLQRRRSPQSPQGHEGPLRGPIKIKNRGPEVPKYIDIGPLGAQGPK